MGTLGCREMQDVHGQRQNIIFHNIENAKGSLAFATDTSLGKMLKTSKPWLTILRQQIADRFPLPHEARAPVLMMINSRFFGCKAVVEREKVKVRGSPSLKMAPYIVLLCFVVWPIAADWKSQQQLLRPNQDIANSSQAYQLFELTRERLSESDHIRVVTVETRDIRGTLLGKSMGFGRVKQIGHGEPNNGYGSKGRIKVVLLKKYLDELVEKEPNAILAFVDSDVIYPRSCSNDHLLRQYNRIVRLAGGPRIVFCAELFRFEHDAKHDVPEFPSWAVREKPQLTGGSITHLRIKAEGGDKKVCYAHCFYDGGGPKFLNSGGFMGPVKYLHEMVNEVDAKMSQFLFHNVKGLEVTLDYLGAVFQAMAGVIVESGAIGVNETGALYNQYFDEKICLAHFNAGAHFSAADSVLKMLGGVSSV
eukprot:jgi/Bigna1/146764/aug1.120_g21472